MSKCSRKRLKLNDFNFLLFSITIVKDWSHTVKKESFQNVKQLVSHGENTQKGTFKVNRIAVRSSSFSHLSVLLLLLHASDVQNVVTPDQEETHII